ncbi:hypothetical protein [Phenylobacterium sp. SCN 70-31]|uniref:hypothetical protein n=1 Tax=Phenylobacterium sp. SCN 70-31 TaxID=1660129 RepID=UPI00086D7946|nr:hypothetical protein [Phenylobacterium sp. SCN 70-31]ODT88475.1 MAG: hypothetical protein ABS78_07650 [Phenylobacterium sp. SCN 70-31]
MRSALPVRGSRRASSALSVAGGSFLLAALCACAPEPEARAAYLDLDCSQPFDAHSAALISQSKLTPAPVEPAEPYRFYSSADGRTSYLITQATAPAHPAIMMQKARGTDVITTGCAYGDEAAYDQLLAYLDSLKAWTRK